MSVYLVSESAKCAVCSAEYTMWIYYPEEKKAICSDKCRELYRLNPMAYEKGDEIVMSFVHQRISDKAAMRLDSALRTK